ncbi:DUF4870 domain-containing protein [Paenibacillus harenae]|uniref:Tic20 family protein n=1 Tax=Paenibacillus harenae TaxID=306543 RepID=A0ABT9U9I7_PAEHA|nr:DUF4870 domain-containing protein [Paenibacillus harenae]MDQ0063907.1 putative Tic20 family protein [Paenibacillus harenae]MDQ0116312.1 putative Tic20 family protein [Paenibacillus harenae]
MNHPYSPHPEEKQFAMLCHVIAFAGFIIPFGSIIGPLIIWLIKKDQSPYVNAHGKESLNFQISILIYGLVSAILWLVFIGIFVSIAVGIFWLVMTIIGTIRATEGQYYRYPLTIRFLK